MTYILIGPGIRDRVSLENLFPNRVVEQAAAVSPIKPVQTRETSGQTQTGQEQSAQTQKNRQASKTYEEVQEPKTSRVKAVMAEQIMTSPVQTVTQEHSVAEAWEFMLANTFRHIPVVERDTGQMVGMLSEHDFIQHAAELGGLPPKPYTDAKIQYVRQLMSSPTLSATVDTELHELSRVMYDRHIGAMPILDDEGKMLGIITHRDILKALIKTEPLELWI